MRKHFFLVDFLCSATSTGALAWVEFAETSLYFEVILSVRGFAMETLWGSLRRMTDCRIATVTSVVLDRSVHFTYFCSLEVVTKSVDFVELNGF